MKGQIVTLEIIWAMRGENCNIEENVGDEGINCNIKENVGDVDINKTLAYRANTFVFDIMDGSFRKQYRRIHDYGHELLRENPRSTVKIRSHPFQGEEENSEYPKRQMNPHFQRMYI